MFKNFSPLEQFEINSFNNFLTFTNTFSFENLETKFFNIFNLYLSTYTLFDIIFILSIVLFFQTIIQQKGYIHLYTFIAILLIGINVISFSDVLINTIEYQYNYMDFTLNIINSNFITIITQNINIYSVAFCFIFIYITIYLIYNKFLSNNTNTLIPTLYQILAENLYKLSLNLFYSILGKHISIPEFFIKINTIFIFLLISNIQGMIPYMSTLTSALTNTFFIALALFISILTTLLDKKGINYFLNLFMPSGCPILLSLLIIPIEVISYSFRLVSLSVRLFANMMAGHTLLKVIVGFS